MALLPRPPTSLVGRDADIVKVLDHLARGARLLTLTGLGGVGKTRLALAVGERLAARGVDGAHVDATALHSDAELVVALADALELDVGGVAGPRLESALRRALSRALPHPTVVVVDNFEHLATTGADVLVGCLAAAPSLTFIVTSRVALARPEELALPVVPLATAGPSAAAVALLAERAGDRPAWRDDHAALTRLAARLDGLPLALELAAARAAIVTPGELCTILDEETGTSLLLPGQHPRRASREAAVAWSWDQLDAAHRLVLTRLALPECPVDFELAKAIAGLPRAETLLALDGLARYALIAALEVEGAARYRVLETVRDFVASRVPDDELARGWAAIAGALLARVEPHVSAFSRELPAEVAARVRADRELYLAVLRRGTTSADPQAIADALRVATFLVPLSARSGAGAIAAAWTATILERPEVALLPLTVRLGAAVVLVVARVGSDDGVIARTMARIDAWVDASSESQIATAALGIVHYYRWEHRALLALADAMRGSRAAMKSPGLEGYIVAAWASARRALGLSDPEADDRALAAALERLPAPRHVTSACLVSLARASVAIHHGLARAPALIDDGLGIARAAGFAWFEALFTLERGRLHLDHGRFAEAERDLSAALARFDPRSAVRERQETTLDLALLAIVRGRHADARARLDEAAARLKSPFERALGPALRAAVDALEGSGEAAAPPTVQLTGSIEDVAIGLLASLGEAPAIDRDARARSFRIRRAGTLATAAHGLASGAAGDHLAVSLDGASFRVAAEWIELAPKPLLSALLRALVDAWQDGPDGVDRDRLGAILWPDERLHERSRDQRLHTAVSALRRDGLGAHLESHEGRYRIAPTTIVLRVAPTTWAGTGVKRARGRGRPRRDQGPS